MALVITRADLLTRARSALTPKGTYRLGGGHTDPDFESPLDADGTCDCSAFICWALQLHKFDKSRTWLQVVNGGYLNTDGVWWDAVKTELGIFNMVGWGQHWRARPDGRGLTVIARAGDLIVYPALWVARGAQLGALDRNIAEHKGTLPGVGHIVMITDPTPDVHGNPLVIDCSAAAPGDAIREHRWFPTHPAAVVARCSLVTD